MRQQWSGAPADVDGDFCAVCVNTQQADWVPDAGCPPHMPTCVCGIESPELWYAGLDCVEFPHECINTAPHGGQDAKCDADTPICVGSGRSEIEDYSYGDECVKCLNSQQSDSVADYGCSADKPRCVNADGTVPLLNLGGEVCEPAEPKAGGCTDCYPGSSGSCKTVHGVCHHLPQEP